MVRKIAGKLLMAVAVVVAMSAWADVCQACPNCKDSLAGQSGETMNVARGYALSILIMLGMPFTLAGSFGLYVWREMRRMNRQSIPGADPQALPPKP
jgi:hypothetical protein